MLLKLYTILTFFGAPFIHAYLLKRKRAGKEDPARFYERLGRPSLMRPRGDIVWIHAASVGESISVLPLIGRIAEQFPTLRILLTTGTTTSAKMIDSRLPPNAFHQYIPVDTIRAVKRFLYHWQPSLALWVESELWPNLLQETAKTCPMILVNARISNRSFATWKQYPSISHTLLGCFSLCLPQSEQDGERLKTLGAQHVHYIGNLKYDAPPLPTNAEKMAVLQTMVGKRPVWVASSTHPGEEERIAQIHHLVKAHNPDLLTIIVPRHSRRGGELAATLSQKYIIALRSANQPIKPETDIYLADTMGELGLFYRLAPIVLIGGSLVNRGGQNPLEAARLRAAIITGPHMENFRDIIHEFQEKHACIRVEDDHSLAKVLDDLLRNTAKRENMADTAFSIAEGKGAILDGYSKSITPFIESIHAV